MWQYREGTQTFLATRLDTMLEACVFAGSGRPSFETYRSETLKFETRTQGMQVKRASQPIKRDHVPMQCISPSRRSFHEVMQVVRNDSCTGRFYTECPSHR